MGRTKMQESPTVIRTRTVVAPAPEKSRGGRKLRRAIFIGIVIGAYAMGGGAAPAPAKVSQECESWAAMIEAPAGDYRMQLIGCDEQANGTYIRESGECASLARFMWRRYHNLQALPLQVEYYNPSCFPYDDGSWGQDI